MEIENTKSKIGILDPILHILSMTMTYDLVSKIFDISQYFEISEIL